MAMTRKAFNVGLVLVLVMISLKIFFIDRSPFGKDNSSYALDKDKIVSRIEMTRGDEKLIIKDDNGTLSVNGTTRVRKGEVITLLNLISEIQIKSPVSDDAFNEVVIKPGIEPVKVKIFVKNRLIKTYLVYRTESNVYGNIMKTSEKAKPFIIYAPGFENNIGSFFELNELVWLPYTVFNLMPSEIDAIDVRYNEDKESSFKIETDEKNKLITDSEGATITNCDSLKVLRYLSYYTYVPFEKWAFELSQEEKGKIILQEPSVKISVSTKSGQNIILSIWERKAIVGSETIVDTDRVWGRLDNSDNIFIMRYFDIDPILKKKAYFIRFE
jgi:hypothetical protein